MTDSKKAAAMWRHITREPLVGFTLIAAVFFAVFASVSNDEEQVIELDRAAIDRMISDRALVLGRDLTSAEVAEATENFIDQEVLVREAMKRHLYLNDGRVRHRLADKMFYLLTDEVGVPDAGDLEAFYAEYRQRYSIPERISIEHRFFSEEVDAESNIGAGQDFYMGPVLTEYAAAELMPIFGGEFVRRLSDLEVDQWSEPMKSSRGWHRVLVTERFDREPVPFERLNAALVTDWQQAQLMQQRRDKLDELRKDYTIIDVDGQRR